MLIIPFTQNLGTGKTIVTEVTIMMNLRIGGGGY